MPTRMLAQMANGRPRICEGWKRAVAQRRWPVDPLLRTLAPLLRGLERHSRGWLDGKRRYPLTMIQRAEMEGLGGGPFGAPGAPVTRLDPLLRIGPRATMMGPTFTALAATGASRIAPNPDERGVGTSSGSAWGR